MSKVDLKVDWATHAAAKYACKNWHYSGCLPGAKKTMFVGAWEDGVFIGVVIYSPGATNMLGSPYGLNQTSCTELVRVALSKHQSFVSEIISKSFKFLKKRSPGIRLIVSFADPREGHTGVIYQAGNWIYTGETTKTSAYKTIQGKIIHPRSIGASDFKKGKKKALPTGAVKIILPGKHRYLMPLDKKMRKQILPLSKPYPKKHAAEVGNGSDQEHSGGSTPTQPLQAQEMKNG